MCNWISTFGLSRKFIGAKSGQKEMNRDLMKTGETQLSQYLRFIEYWAIFQRIEQKRCCGQEKSGLLLSLVRLNAKKQDTDLIVYEAAIYHLSDF